MPEENLTVVGCPTCKGEGRTLKFEARFKDPISLIHDFEPCSMCKGSGLVFVVPARVIGPAQER